jgi:hypothetical protein
MVLSGFTIEGGEENTGGFHIARTGDSIVEDCHVIGYRKHCVVEGTVRAIVRGCTFENHDTDDADNVGGGALMLKPVVYSPGIEVVGCTFRNNIGPGGVPGGGWGGGGAIATDASTDGSEVTIRECLFDGNQSDSAGAVFAVGYVWVLHNTFVNNVSQDGAIVLGLPSTSHGVFHNIFAFNSRYALWDDTVGRCGCNAYWENDAGDDVGFCVEDDTFENFYLDPQFCDPDAGNYRLQKGSPLAGPFEDEDHSSCEAPIGAFGEGCTATPVLDTSWGHLKARFSTPGSSK